MGSDATGDIYYRNSSGNIQRLGIGTTGQVLSVSSGLPSWQPAASADGSETIVNAGTSISVSGTGTSGDPYIIANTNPDQTVVLNNGTGISVTGTYPSFTIASVPYLIQTIKL